jgi:hypothetical protein
VALPFTLKSILKAKERRIMGTQIFNSPCKNNIIFKNSSKRNQNPSKYIITL